MKDFAQQFTPFEPPVDPVDSETQRQSPPRDGGDVESCGRAPAIEPFRPFPVDALPEPLRGFVNVSAEAIGCDPSYVAVPALVVTAAAIGNSYRVVLKRGWSEPAVLWAAIVGESGTLKSPAFKLAPPP